MRDIYSKVKYPQVRANLIESLLYLSDREFQIKNWISSDREDGFYYSLLFELEFLYDDIDLYEHPERGIGYITINSEENNILKPLYQTLDNISSVIGDEQPDSAYINSPLWDRVVETAAAALKVFMKNEEEAKKLNPIPWQGEDDWAPDPEGQAELEQPDLTKPKSLSDNCLTKIATTAFKAVKKILKG